MENKWRTACSVAVIWATVAGPTMVFLVEEMWAFWLPLFIGEWVVMKIKS